MSKKELEELTTFNQVKYLVLKLRLGKNKLKAIFQEWRDLIKQFPSKSKEYLATLIADLHDLDRKLTTELLFELELNPKLIESVTTSSLAISPGSGFGFGTDKIDREKDELFKKRKKQLSKTQIKQLTGEQAMKTVVTFTSNNRESIGLQYTIIDNQNHTSLDTWELSTISSEGDSHSFTVTSTMPDQWLSEENLNRHLVAGVKMTLTQVNSMSDAEQIAESMINAISRGMSPDRVTEAYLGSKKVKFTEAEDDSSDGESSAVDALQTSILSIMRMTDDLKMSDEDAKTAKGLIDQVAQMMKGGTTEKKEERLTKSNSKSVSEAALKIGSKVVFKNKYSKLFNRKAVISKANSSGSYEVKLVKPLPSGVGILTVTGNELELTEALVPLKGNVSTYIKNFKDLSKDVQSLLNSAEKIGTDSNSSQINFADRTGKLIASATVKTTHGDGKNNPVFNSFDSATVSNVFKNVNGKGVKVEASPNFQFAIGVAREDASEANEAFTRPNISPATVFGDGDMTIFGFNQSENSSGEERFEAEDITKILDLEGVAHVVIDGKNFTATPVTLDI